MKATPAPIPARSATADIRRVRIIRREAPCATIGRMDAVARRGHRVRLDQLLVERGLAPSRTRAQALLLAGRVRVGEGDAAREKGDCPCRDGEEQEADEGDARTDHGEEHDGEG